MGALLLERLLARCVGFCVGLVFGVSLRVLSRFECGILRAHSGEITSSPGLTVLRLRLLSGDAAARPIAKFDLPATVVHL